ncbi:MAG: hypothetical protein DMG81_17490 [Acidobacteria bacterium]|nr:MAG: hypothetical protein DMG81_17490 [Acidobacteriota bacterium]
MLAYQKKGFPWPEATAKSLPVKIYGEYVEYQTFHQPNGSSSEPSWSEFYDDSKKIRRAILQTVSAKRCLEG